MPRAPIPMGGLIFLTNRPVPCNLSLSFVHTLNITLAHRANTY
jgi:hypothetical protein